jgi:hypothetical protein
MTFISAIAAFVIVAVLVLPIQLPNLRHKERDCEEEDAEAAADE